ncbi:MAG: CBS domain-containing protein [Candidatus Omnitrophica bacterium]|nr:CBS domain-containing protein [Candidatus Omnitrophota bacterium]MDD5671740.1 CBS domain-containing protein [Candidatus Omnitrophota bacterium]
MSDVQSTDIRDLRAADIMRTDVIMAAEDMNISRLSRLFAENKVTGVPVISKAGGVIGVVSKTDLVNLKVSASDDPKGEVPPFFRVVGGGWDEKSCEVDFEDLKSFPEKTAKDIMTPWIVAALPDTPLTQLAGTMVHEGIHRVLIVDANKNLKGIVTSMDIVRAVSRCAKANPH